MLKYAAHVDDVNYWEYCTWFKINNLYYILLYVWYINNHLLSKLNIIEFRRCYTVDEPVVIEVNLRTIFLSKVFRSWATPMLVHMYSGWYIGCTILVHMYSGWYVGCTVFFHMYSGRYVGCSVFFHMNSGWYMLGVQCSSTCTVVNILAVHCYSTCTLADILAVQCL